MKRFEVGDQVRIDIPDRDDPDFERHHGRIGEVIEVIEDDADEHTGDQRDSYLFAVKFEGNDTDYFRWRDLRPAPEQ